MRIPSPYGRRRARIEIIPLIDIMFFLLATFMMVSLSMVKNRGIPVNLPVASSAVAQDRRDYHSVTITEDGGIYFNKLLVSLDELVVHLKQLQQTEGDPRIFINGDQRARYGVAIAVLDEVRKLGITKIAIETQAKP
jgi:biopolymer transport protein ExbD